MPKRTVTVRTHDAEQFTAGMLAISAELDIAADFPPDVVAAAEKAAAAPKLPDLDRTDIEFVTVDPPGAKDLDQALHIERNDGGFRVHYAIADVAAFVEPGGLIDVEAHKRGQTLYAPDRRIPLHPPVLSEDAASLLPDQTRPALLWTIDLDFRGEQVNVNVERALVRSRGQFDYAAVQQQIDGGSAGQVFGLLKDVGELRLQREIERGGVSLPLPEQEVVAGDDGWSLAFRELHPVEEWNAQISLLTGMGAAEVMLYGEIGILRTLPPADHRAVAKLRRTATALGLAWPADMRYPDFVRSIDANSPAGAAMLNACTTLLRGAAYVAFDGGVPEHVDHAAIAHEYSHVTAPLRRLVDRYTGEVAVALSNDTEVPEWVRSALRALPQEMAESDKRAHRFERAVLDLVEAGVLSTRVGQIFSGVVIEVSDKDASRGAVMLQDPPVEAEVRGLRGSSDLGQTVQLKLVEADKSHRRVRFKLA